MSTNSNQINIEKSRAAVLESKAYSRLCELFDQGTMVELDPFVMSGSCMAEVVTAYGSVNGVTAYAFSQDTTQSGGAISKAVAAKVNKLLDYAAMNGCPVIGIYDSEGARLKQGADMLDAYGSMLMRINNISGVVPQISVVAGVCIGTNALLAASADVVICAENAEYGVDTAGGNFAAADAAAHGNAQLVAASDSEAIAMARQIVSLLPANNLDLPVQCEFAEPDGSQLDALAAQVSGSEDVMPSIISAIVDAESFLEMSADFGKSVITGLATVAGSTVGVVATRFCEAEGIIDHESATKAARFVRFCDSFSVPVVTLADAAGFTSVRESSMLAHAYSEATTVKLSVVAGAAYGAAYIALAGRASNADVTVAWPGAVIAPLAPETAAMILFNDRLAGCSDPAAERSNMVEEYKTTIASPMAAAQNGNIEGVIAPAETRSRLAADLAMMASKRVSRNPKKHSNIQL